MSFTFLSNSLQVEVGSNTDQNVIRQVQKSTVVPPPRRTAEDIEKEVAESRKVSEWFK